MCSALLKILQNFVGNIPTLLNFVRKIPTDGTKSKTSSYSVGIFITKFNSVGIFPTKFLNVALHV